MNTTVKIIAGFLVGTAIGASVGLLMAPSTGKTTRKNLNKKAKKLVKKLETAFAKQKKKGVHVSNQLKGNHVRNGKSPAVAR